MPTPWAECRRDYVIPKLIKSIANCISNWSFRWDKSIATIFCQRVWESEHAKVRRSPYTDNPLPVQKFWFGFILYGWERTSTCSDSYSRRRRHLKMAPLFLISSEASIWDAICSTFNQLWFYEISPTFRSWSRHGDFGNLVLHAIRTSFHVKKNTCIMVVFSSILCVMPFDYITHAVVTHSDKSFKKMESILILIISYWRYCHRSGDCARIF